MVIHFICRGNCFRSIIAEAYVNSLGVKGVTARSSGTVAEADQAGNQPYYIRTLDLLGKHGIGQFAKDHHGDQLTPTRLAEADLVVCLNQRVYDEGRRYVAFPADTRIWSVADIGEPGRIPKTESERELYREEAYWEIVGNVNQLVASLATVRQATTITVTPTAS